MINQRNSSGFRRARVEGSVIMEAARGAYSTSSQAVVVAAGLTE